VGRRRRLTQGRGRPVVTECWNRGATAAMLAPAIETSWAAKSGGTHGTRARHTWCPFAAQVTALSAQSVRSNSCLLSVSRPRFRPQRRGDRPGAGALGCDWRALDQRHLPELPRAGRREGGARQGGLRRQLRPARCAEGEMRPGEPLPDEHERHARELRRLRGRATHRRAPASVSVVVPTEGDTLKERERRGRSRSPTGAVAVVQTLEADAESRRPAGSRGEIG
jgi:hypothetical protein